MKLISVVVPIHNEQECIPELHARLDATFRKELSSKYDWELLFVNDGSTDRSRELLEDLAEKDSKVGVVHFVHNFGQDPAYEAGLSKVRGDYVVFLDADLQNPPEEIPKLIAPLEKGHDIVYGVRANRQDSGIRKIGSWLVNSMLQRMFKFSVKDPGTPFRAMTRRVVEHFNRLNSPFRNSILLMELFSKSSIEIPTKHDARGGGETHYKFFTCLRMTLDLVMNFTPHILRFITYLGFLFSCLSFAGGLYYIFQKLFTTNALPGFTSIVVLITFFFSVTMMFFGILSEYIAKLYLHTQNRPRFVIDQTLGVLAKKQHEDESFQTVIAAQVTKGSAKTTTHSNNVTRL